MRHALPRTALALLTASLLSATAWAAPDADALRRTVDDAIRPLMAEHHIPGMAVAVTVDGQAYFFNYGETVPDTHAPVRETTLFELGSVSKTFTATLGLYARSLGKLSLADHPGHYLPALQGKPIDRATLLQLGTYTAGGLPLQFPDEAENSGDAIAYLQQWQPSAAPGEMREYSNPSIGLFGHIAATVLHRDFADAMQGFFPRLGLEHSYIRIPEAAMADYAWGTDNEDKPARVSPGLFDVEAYGVKTSTADMIRFVQDNIDPSRLQAHVRQAVAGTHIGYYQIGPMVQGLGWEQYAYPVSLPDLLAGNSSTVIFDPQPAKRLAQSPTGPRLFNKTGSTRGFGAYVAFVPSQRIGIVMLANRNYPIPARVTVAYAILDALAPKAKAAE